MAWLQTTGLAIHTAQHGDLVAGVTSSVSWEDKKSGGDDGLSQPPHLGMS